MDWTEIKKKTGYNAADTLVRDSMIIVLGTGSTAVHAITRIGQMLSEGRIKKIQAIATSFQSEYACQEAGIPLVRINDPGIYGNVDLAIDGADEVDPQFRLIKGGGGALLPEKILDYSAKHFAVVVDEQKLVAHLGTGFPIPIEVIPFARVCVTKALEAMRAQVSLRMAGKKMGPEITDQGNIILDIRFEQPIDPAEYEVRLKNIPGVVENGLFSTHVSEVFVGKTDGTVVRLTKPNKGTHDNS